MGFSRPWNTELCSPVAKNGAHVFKEAICLSVFFTFYESYNCKKVSHSLVVRNSLKILTQIKHTYKVPGISICTPFCHNHTFTPALLDNAFVRWCAKGLKCIKDCYFNNNFASFGQLSSKYNLSSSNFFRYMQLRHFGRENIPNFETTCESRTFFYYSLSPESKKLITKSVWRVLGKGNQG